MAICLIELIYEITIRLRLFFSKEIAMRVLTSMVVFFGVLTALVLPAQANTGAIHPLSQVSVGGPPRLVDLTPQSAGLTFQSKVPLACTVIFGKTRSFGKITNDPVMGAVATIDHNPVLGGLEPNTKYYYRVQGISADGVFYAGQVRAFTTPAEVAAPAGLTPLAATVKAVSSNYGGGANDQAWGADSAIDGDISTAWSSSGDGGDAFLVIDFGRPQSLGAIEVWTRTMSDGTAQIFTFKVTTDSGESFGPFTLPDAKKPYRFALETTARWLRIEAVKTSGGNTGFVEIVGYGKVGS